MREAFLDVAAARRARPDPRARSDYRFVDPEAQRRFDELMEHLREQVMGAYFRSMAEGLQIDVAGGRSRASATCSPS